MGKSKTGVSRKYEIRALLSEARMCGRGRGFSALKGNGLTRNDKRNLISWKIFSENRLKSLFLYYVRLDKIHIVWYNVFCIKTRWRCVHG